MFLEWHCNVKGHENREVCFSVVHTAECVYKLTFSKCRRFSNDLKSGLMCTSSGRLFIKQTRRNIDGGEVIFEDRCYGTGTDDTGLTNESLFTELAIQSNSNNVNITVFGAVVLIFLSSWFYFLWICQVITLTGNIIIIIIKYSKPLTSATFSLHRVFYCVACSWVVIGCQRDRLLLGRLLWLNLRRTRWKLRPLRDALVKGLLFIKISKLKEKKLSFYLFLESCWFWVSETESFGFFW